MSWRSEERRRRALCHEMALQDCRDEAVRQGKAWWDWAVPDKPFVPQLQAPPIKKPAILPSKPTVKTDKFIKRITL